MTHCLTSNSGNRSQTEECPICWSRISEDKAKLSVCLHEFCFQCILKWSQIKNKCPVCRQSFPSIIHNIRSDSDYDEVFVNITVDSDDEEIDDNIFVDMTDNMSISSDESVISDFIDEDLDEEEVDDEESDTIGS